MPERILVVEDDTTIRVALGEVLGKLGHDVVQAETGREALERSRQQNFDLVLLDLRLPDMHGLDVLRSLREADAEALVVVMTAFPEVRTAIDSVKAGAYDYINKPFDLDDLRELVRRALETRRLRLEVARLRISAARPANIEGMIGTSSAFLAMLEVTRKIASAGRVPVLIRGESGTGKERIAQAIHSLSPRAGGPWVTLNCSALAEGLLESEMFGHEKGAFTDAKSMKRGLLELADGGTLFLDEIGDMAPALQPKLLRAIETQTFRRVGGQKEVQVDVRFVAATNRDLDAMVRAGAFREDLYYRLNVGSIDVPPLRARREDVLPLARRFIAEAARVMGLPEPGLAADTHSLLAAYAWPGNVRELRNVMERALILSAGAPIRPAHLPREVSAASSEREGAGADPGLVALDEVEKRHIRRVLEACAGNKTQAAKLLGISRLTLRNKVADYGWSEFQPEGSAER
ncbi:MAG: sigma-54-dependent Fis family transcriptional regulator [Betaproteobacteria bacterium]|nr:sigma-54-dependent Fis family transcriptional regulator [Betaproteobacteria bacterium]